MSRGESNRRRIVGACALVAAVLVTPLAHFSASSAAGSTPQTITFGPLADRTLVQAALVVSASSTSGLTVTFSTTTPSICSSTGTNGTVISPISPGTCTVKADQAGNATFAAADPVLQNFNVTKAQQTITFAPLSDRQINQGAIVVTATASTGFTVTFTTTTPLVCTSTGTNGATITPVAIGSCTVQADQAGNTIFAAAPSVQQTFSIGKSSQAITFAPLADQTTLQTPVTVSATSTSLLTVTFTTTTPTVCTSGGVNGATITLLTSGTCSVEADQPGNATFSAAAPVVRGFQVTKAAQTITFGALSDHPTTDSPITVAATASSGLTVTFSTSTPSVCTAGGTNNATISLIAGGTCTVRADQAGNATWAAAAPLSHSFTVTKANQTIAFAALTDLNLLAPPPITVGATATSGLAVTFTTTTPAVCNTGGSNGTTITLLTAGLCTVKADQGGNSIFNAAPSVLQSFTVTKADQTINFAALTNQNLLASPITVAATAASGLPVVLTSTTPAVCTAGGAGGTTITLLGPGVCTVQADQAGNAVYNAAPSVLQSFTVTKVDQTINFAALGDIPIGPPITISATASSGLTVTFTTTTPAVCTASGTNGTTITFVAAGTCTIDADQAGNGVYNAAPTVEHSFGVGKTDQTITFGALSSVAVNQPPITVAATATSGLGVVFSTTTPTVCTASGVNGATITIVAAGTCSVIADQSGNELYNAAPSVGRSFAVTKLAQAITFTAPATVTLPHAPVTVQATASSLLPVSFTSTTPGVCTTGSTNGAKVTLVKAGTCIVRADQAGDATYVAAAPVTRQFVVKAAVITTPRSGYWMLGADGRVYAFGDATDFGSSGGAAVAFAARRDGKGYWVVDSTGDVRAFGSATFHGGQPALLNGETVSTISATPTGNGYWLFTSTGRVFAYGDAHFFGDMRAVTLNGPIVASIATPTGLGYYMVGSDGGVFSFGDAHFHGSMGAAHLNQPIVGLSPTPDNRGYWLVASDGGVFAFGAPFRGSLGAVTLNRPVNGLVAYGNGYLMVASDGGVFDFSDKAFVGSLGDKPLAAPIVGIAALLT